MPLLEAQPNAVAKSYAQSLFQLAEKAGGQPRVEETLAELEAVLEIARQDARFGEFLASRVIGPTKKRPALKNILEGRVSDLAYRFIVVLNDNGRLALLPGIVAAYSQMVNNASGRTEVDVYTAAPIDAESRELLTSRLRETLGREPVLHAYVDESLIGGVRLQIGDQLIDGSVATRLRKVRQQLASKGLPKVRAAAERLFGPDPASNGH
jgi:F-type H+-transporting ATPase subunit delta